MSRLAELLDVSLSNATGLVDRMEERGLVERVRVPDDRRVVLVRLTAAGQAALADDRDRCARTSCERSSAGSTTAQLERLHAALHDLRTAIRAEADANADLFEAHHRHPSQQHPDHREHDPRCRKAASTPPTSVHVPTLAEDPALGLRQRAKMEILFAVMLGLFLGALDQTIVGPALPTIVTQLAGNDLLHLGRHDLPADQHDHRPVLGQAVRPLRPQADVHDRHRASSWSARPCPA